MTTSASLTISAPEPGFQKTGMTCKACKHDWLADMPVKVQIDRWVAYMKSIRCPNCKAGSKKLAFGRSITPAQNLERTDFSLPLHARIHQWRETGDTGLSSEAIAYTALQGPNPNKADHPHDISDLSRCILLTQRIPEFNMTKMAPVSATWARIASRWTELVALWHQELGEDLTGKEAPPNLCPPRLPHRGRCMTCQPHDPLRRMAVSRQNSPAEAKRPHAEWHAPRNREAVRLRKTRGSQQPRKDQTLCEEKMGVGNWCFSSSITPSTFFYVNVSDAYDEDGEYNEIMTQLDYEGRYYELKHILGNIHTMLPGVTWRPRYDWHKPSEWNHVAHKHTQQELRDIFEIGQIGDIHIGLVDYHGTLVVAIWSAFDTKITDWHGNLMELDEQDLVLFDEETDGLSPKDFAHRIEHQVNIIERIIIAQLEEELGLVSSGDLSCRRCAWTSTPQTIVYDKAKMAEAFIAFADRSSSAVRLLTATHACQTAQPLKSEPKEIKLQHAA